jgi:outer membrane protein OmpA-like peptidoglycan-associated protein
MPDTIDETPENQSTEAAGASSQGGGGASTGDRTAADVWSDVGRSSSDNTSTADEASDVGDSDGVHEDDARLQSVPDSIATADADSVYEDDARLQSVPSTNIGSNTDGVYEDDARLQSVASTDSGAQRDAVHEDDSRLQSVPDDDRSADPDGVREDDARQQSVRDDWDGFRTETKTYAPSGKVDIRGDLYSSNDKDRVLHPSEGVGYPFDKSQTDVNVLNARIESLPADVQAALKRGDDNVRVTITAQSSREGSPEHNQDLSDARGQDMAHAMKELGVKSPIGVVPLGESRAEAAGHPDVDNPADRVATFEVQVTERVAPPIPTDTKPPENVDLPEFKAPTTKAEEVLHDIEKALPKKVVDVGTLPKTIWNAVKMQWLAGAAGYAGAADDVAKRASADGYSTGLLWGADGRTGKDLAHDFGQWEPGPNAMDKNIAKAGQDGFNKGLLEGFKQAQQLSPEQREQVWRQLEPELGNRGDRAGWSKEDWRYAAVQFRELALKKGEN